MIGLEAKKLGTDLRALTVTRVLKAVKAVMLLTFISIVTTVRTSIFELFS